MQIYPAIDLRHGQCVRLTQGDFAQATIYAHNPLTQMQHFLDQGATWCHVVDLDGAKDPLKNQFDLIKTLVEKSPMAIQTGGGIRLATDVTSRLQAGVSRVIIGSLAVQRPDVVKALFKLHDPDSIVLALDVMIQEGKAFVATHGWQETSSQSVHQVIHYYEKIGLKHVLCTDIHRDGMLQGPNFSLYETLIQHHPHCHIQASGGIHALADLTKLKAIGVDGVIIGKALYENKFTLSEALAC